MHTTHTHHTHDIGKSSVRKKGEEEEERRRYLSPPPLLLRRPGLEPPRDTDLAMWEPDLERPPFSAPTSAKRRAK
jgi:hypothetical protein